MSDENEDSKLPKTQTNVAAYCNTEKKFTYDLSLMDDQNVTRGLIEAEPANDKIILKPGSASVTEELASCFGFESNDEL